MKILSVGFGGDWEVCCPRNTRCEFFYSPINGNRHIRTVNNIREAEDINIQGGQKSKPLSRIIIESY